MHTKEGTGGGNEVIKINRKNGGIKINRKGKGHERKLFLKRTEEKGNR